MKYDMPIKCGQMYIKFDENNRPEYGFLCGRDTIKKFLNLTDVVPREIVLPYINQDAFVPDDQEDMDVAKKYGIGTSYCYGNIKVRPECFKGIKKTTIVVPFNTSVMLDWGCFDDNSDINIVVPENLELRQVFRCINGAFDYDRENWTMLTDKGINIDLNSYSESLDSRPFQETDNRNVRFTLKTMELENDVMGM